VRSSSIFQPTALFAVQGAQARHENILSQAMLAKSKANAILGGLLPTPMGARNNKGQETGEDFEAGKQGVRARVARVLHLQAWEASHGLYHLQIEPLMRSWKWKSPCS
jgi:hypothetical protein